MVVGVTMSLDAEGDMPPVQAKQIIGIDLPSRTWLPREGRWKGLDHV
jgi:hypothetical protein